MILLLMRLGADYINLWLSSVSSSFTCVAGMGRQSSKVLEEVNG